MADDFHQVQLQILKFVSFYYFLGLYLDFCRKALELSK
jgi:hypothetical protein